MKVSKTALLCPSNEESILKAARLIREGKLVAFPTETVYGLGANATDPAAVKAIYSAKGRPSNNPLIVHLPDLESARALGHFNKAAQDLACRFWPGPLTLVVRKHADCPIAKEASRGPTLAIRVPNHPIALKILEAAQVPIVAPSANPSGHLSPTQAPHVSAMMGDRLDMIIDGGPTELGLESTVVDVSDEEVRVLRPGTITGDMITDNVSPKSDAQSGPDDIRSPGLLPHHYAPENPIRLNAVTVRAGEVLLAYGSDVPSAPISMNLSSTGDLSEAARNLFAMLHLLDRNEGCTIAVMPIPEIGIGVAINDRLKRAATPKDAV